MAVSFFKPAASFKPAETESVLRYKGGYIPVGKVGELMERLINPAMAQTQEQVQVQVPSQISTPRMTF
jgi:hypothetical protein